jgi:DNA polymerase III epsilon subunit-like protein
MSLQYYVIDTETTGLKTDWHEITQISIIRCSDRHQLSKYIRAEYPRRADPRALEITGRTEKDILQGDPKEKVVAACNKFLNEDGTTPEHRCFIAHNASFDRRFLHQLWKNCKSDFPVVCWLCTQACVRQYFKFSLGMAKPKVGLAASMQTCGLKFHGTAHNAVSDTRSTYLLREHLVKEGFDFLPFIKRCALEEAPAASDDEES